MRHFYYLIYGGICVLPYLVYLESLIDIRYLAILFTLIVTANYLSLVMLHYKQPHIFYFMNVASGFVLYAYGTTLELVGFNDAAYILSAVIIQFLLFAVGYFIASLCGEI